jgi:peroxiredoxin
MSLSELPENLPVPVNDGAASHLLGTMLPDLTFTATNGDLVTLDAIEGFLVIYIYPMTGRPDVPLPDGWGEIPGARGCTPQSCSFRDHYGELQEFQAKLYGLSAQSTDYQNEAKSRLHLPFELLSDTSLTLKSNLLLPTFKVAGMEFYKRLTLIAKDAKIVKVFYPVFPPDKNIDEVLKWFQANA